MIEFVDPAVAVGAGYAFGQVLETVARKKVVKNRQMLMPSYSKVEKKTKQPLRHKLGRVIGSLALTGALLGGSIYFSFSGHSPKNRNQAPLVQTVVDGSFPAGQDGSFTLAQNIIDKLNLPPGSKLSMAINNTQDEISKGDLSKQVPYGANNVENVAENILNIGFSNAPNDRSNLLKKSDSKSGAEIILNDQNNLFQNISILESLAKDDGNIPVYYLNIVPPRQAIITNQTTQSGEELADQTGGQYINVTQNNLNKVDAEINSIINNANNYSNNYSNSPNNNEEQQWFRIISPVALAFVEGSIYNNRRRETINGLEV